MVKSSLGVAKGLTEPLASARRSTISTLVERTGISATVVVAMPGELWGESSCIRGEEWSLADCQTKGKNL